MTPTCIYCLTAKPLSEFDTEHVIPQSFGTFEPDNLTLEHTVCRECNNRMGRRLEEFFGRDSYEGILRYKFGLSELPSKKRDRFKPRRVSFAIALEGEWKGAILDFTGFGPDGQPVCELAPQAAFKTKEGKLKHIRIDRIPDKKGLEYDELDSKQIHVCGPNEKARAEVIKRLGELGYKVKDWKEGPAFPEGNLSFAMTSRIDEEIKRTIAKIAFNYLAKTQGASFVLSNDFDPIRAYIKDGTKPDFTFFQTDNEPILRDDLPGRRQTTAHLIVLEWDGAKRGINARLSLFNTMTHRVRLCHHFTGVYREIKSGHSLNADTRVIEPLTGTDKRLKVVRVGPDARIRLL